MNRLVEVFLTALKLGCVSFGGPVAHLGYFHDEYVDRRKWLDDARYADLVALCQFLPGPASSQVGYAIGTLRAGWLGGLLAWIGFTLPSAILMLAAAYGVTRLGDLAGAGWLRGLKIAAVAVVADAVWKMGRRLCPDAPRRTIALAGACVLLLLPSALTQVGLIVLGALAGLALFRDVEVSPAPDADGASGPRPSGVRLALIALFGVLLVGLPLAVRITGSHPLAVFETFYRAGALVFGGGHVVLPLLEAGVVGPGWMDPDTFLAGYGMAQALPGPLFAFSAYLGGALDEPPNGVAGGLLALVAIYLPSLLLVAGLLPYWDRVRRSERAKAALMGTNAVVVGILLAALYAPVWTAAIHGARDVVVLLVAAALLFVWKRPAWLVVAVAAGVGAAILRG